MDGTRHRWCAGVAVCAVWIVNVVADMVKENHMDKDKLKAVSDLISFLILFGIGCWCWFGSAGAESITLLRIITVASVIHTLK